MKKDFIIGIDYGSKPSYSAKVTYRNGIIIKIEYNNE